MKELRQKGEYRICMEGDDFTMHKRDEMLITSMSLNKVDGYWNDLMMMCDDD